jgi:hypothetical protein
MCSGGVIMKCDTCGKEVTEVERVVIYKDYDKTGAKPFYNCKECFAKKEQKKSYSKKEGEK